MFWQLAEGIVSSIFLVEYILRLMTITEKTSFGQHGPLYGRLYYAFGTMSAWIDLLATAPFFIERITGISLPTLTILRIFRLFRILKTESYVRAMDAVYRVVYYNAAILYVATLVCIFLTMVTAVLLYLLRPPDDTEHNFTSITATLYLAVLLLTGQGGPAGDFPWYTKSVILLTSIFSVAMFAIPSSMYVSSVVSACTQII
jgi:Ion transport protein